MNNRKRIKIICTTLVIALLILMFFSNTIFNFNATGVTIGFETDGIITTTFHGRGILEYNRNNTASSNEHDATHSDDADRDFFYFSAYFPDMLSFPPEPGVTRFMRFNIIMRELMGLPGDMGEILDVEATDDGQLLVEFLFRGHGNFEGENIDAIIEDTYITSNNLVINDAVKADEFGDFLLVAQRERGMLFGYRYFAKRVDIEVIRRGDFLTEFVTTADLSDPIIFFPENPIKEGDRIRLVGEF